MNYKVDGNKLIIEGKLVYEALGRIDDTLVNTFNSESIIILYDAYHLVPDKDKPAIYRKVDDPELQKTINQNVLCIDREGKILWRIEPTGDRPVDHAHFFEENGESWVYRRDAEEYKIDPTNGKILEFRMGI